MGGIQIGVDFGRASVKVAGVATGPKPRLIGCKLQPVEPRYMGKMGLPEPKEVAKALKEALAAAAPHRLTSCPAIIALSEGALFRKILELPKLDSEDDLRSAVTVQAAEYLPQSVEEMEIDFQVLGQSAESETQQVMVVAASSKLINDYVEVFRIAGIPLQAIDTKPAALGRVLQSPKGKEAMLILDIGSELSTVSVYHGGMIQVTSTVNLGGEIIKDQTTGKVDEEREPALIARLVEELSEEVEHVLKFYVNRSLDGQSVKDAVITGGGSLIPHLVTGLKEALTLTVADPSPRITLPAFCDRRFNGAIGAALYSF